MKKSICITILSAAFCILTGTGSAGASPVFTDTWDPADVLVKSTNPYYFTLGLPGWDYLKKDYSEAVLDITYYDQYYLDILIYAIDPASVNGSAEGSGILLGTVPWSGSPAAGTARFDILTRLDENTFNALFRGQGILYLMADCYYVFDSAYLSLEANPVPVPPALVLMGSGLLGLAWLRRSLVGNRQ